MRNKTVVVALGGNAITREFEEGNITQQFENTRRSLLSVIEYIKQGYRVVLTHGNGPQVGNALVRVEETRHLVPPLPLGIIVADLEGGMGYMIEQCLQNKLNEKKQTCLIDFCKCLCGFIVKSAFRPKSFCCCL